MNKHRCESCSWVGEDAVDIDDVLERVFPGEVMPSGQCPECGALCHPAPDVESPTSSKHTPGPWELRGARLVTDKHGVVIAEKIGSNGGGSESNARLIASAPELLEALEACLPYVIEEYNACLDLRDAEGDEAASKIKVLIERAEAAIAKARGER